MLRIPWVYNDTVQKTNTCTKDKHMYIPKQIRARTNVATFECSFVFVTFVSRFFATKHSLILIMSKSCTDYNYVKVSLMPQRVEKFTINNGYYLPNL